ncbi:uncharacterized protein BcabD6B2_53780 [Babesia caballi]|uniref:Uncharacterized protein n=1 Tax=Babesia caballi TaxID=5871 RepID=A0AAV4M1T5_BABCB|nr:hypothetical protein BcabD6B2_29290 [Babesia caballi]GIX65472.1 hypothetical protein BcabD6B2_49070 [Babesia caballi]GIX65943.1 hypothetical protein BcabD6B2_53780 [Babesia caballi]
MCYHDDQGDTTTTRPTTVYYITVPISLLVTTALGENYVTISRQKGAHKRAKAAEVEAVGATGQCGETRIASEGGGGGAGGLDVGGGTAANVQLGPTVRPFAPPVEVRKAVEQHRPDAQEDEGTSSFVIGALRPFDFISFICGLIFALVAYASIFKLPILITDELSKTLSQLGNRTTGLPGEPYRQLVEVLTTDTGTVVPNFFKVSLEGLEV